MIRNWYIGVIAALAFFTSCGTVKTTQRSTPRESYANRLDKAELDRTALGQRWFEAAEKSYRNPVAITLPFREKGYFSETRPDAISYSFTAGKDETVTITVATVPEAKHIFTELWYNSNGRDILKAFSDTAGTMTYQIEAAGNYILRLQPELLQSISYTCTITSGGLLMFPVIRDAKSKIGSFWGDGRDGGSRKHEGIDIFAERYTPAVASLDGTVMKTGENKLGGKVVWIHAQDHPYDLYYAHLDSQLVEPGMFVRAGQPIGLIGNTGNARTSSPHLHFGVYIAYKALDPMPLLQYGDAKEIKADTAMLNRLVKCTNATKVCRSPRIADSIQTLDKETLLTVCAATDTWYRVLTPDGFTGYVYYKDVNDLSQPIAMQTLNSEMILYDKPDERSGHITTISSQTQVPVWANYKNYLYISHNETYGWIKAEN